MPMNNADRPAISSYDKITLNADGSPDLYFGPKATAGLESNWGWRKGCAPSREPFRAYTIKTHRTFTLSTEATPTGTTRRATPNGRCR